MAEFVGGRLREAREARGKAAAELAVAIGVTRQAVSQFELGQAKPRAEIVERICNVLQVPPHQLTSPLTYDLDETSGLYWRSLASAARPARLAAKRRHFWQREIVGYLENHIRFPTAKLPDLSVDPSTLTGPQIEAVAQETRSHWGLGDGPIDDVAFVLESHGVIVSRGPLGQGLSAFSGWRGDGRPFMTLGSDSGAAVRSRFDAAHELGHLILHRSVQRPSDLNPKTHDTLEAQAHRFAAAFLFPADSFQREVRAVSLDGFRRLKPRWRISIAAMIYRAKDLGFVEGEELRRLWINRNRRGWRTSEPLDDVLEVEEPGLLKTAIELIVDRGRKTRAEIRSDLPYGAADIEDLTGLERGYLSETKPSVGLIDLAGQGA